MARKGYWDAEDEIDWSDLSNSDEPLACDDFCNEADSREDSDDDGYYSDYDNDDDY